MTQEGLQSWTIASAQIQVENAIKNTKFKLKQ